MELSDKAKEALKELDKGKSRKEAVIGAVLYVAAFVIGGVIVMFIRGCLH